MLPREWLQFRFSATLTKGFNLAINKAIILLSKEKNYNSITLLACIIANLSWPNHSIFLILLSSTFYPKLKQPLFFYKYIHFLFYLLLSFHSSLLKFSFLLHSLFVHVFSRPLLWSMKNIWYYSYPIKFII